jgi:ribonuclease BN (tRNA processing enzyme)
MVELGESKRLFFDFGPGCTRNIIANQVPVPEINDIFITHLHIDTCPICGNSPRSMGAGSPYGSLDHRAARPKWVPGPCAST